MVSMANKKGPSTLRLSLGGGRRALKFYVEYNSDGLEGK